jgi:hypothetical protein
MGGDRFTVTYTDGGHGPGITDANHCPALTPAAALVCNQHGGTYLLDFVTPIPPLR